jgi:hypothetical protein
MTAEELWAEFITEGHCGLCGNYGLLTTRVATPRGHWIGVTARPCICPNGRAIKRAVEAKRSRKTKGPDMP